MAYSFRRIIHAYLFWAVGIFCAFQMILSATSSIGMAQSSDCMMKTLEASEVSNASGVYQQFKTQELDAWMLSTLSYENADKALFRNGFTTATIRLKILKCINLELQKNESSPEACRSLQGPCGHGICQFNPSSKEYSCSCNRGYSGPACQEDVDECASQPCKNFGTCKDQVNAFDCLCFHGYTGATCEEEPLSNKDVNRIMEKMDDTGPTFIRWGRTSCPNTSHLLYHGLTAGAHHGHKGSGSNPLCLPNNPVYARHADHEWGGILYGAQYNMQGRGEPYLASFSGGDIPCAVCEAKGKETIFMQPARNRCPFNWVREYHGYLMSSLYHHDHSSQFLCFDDSIEKVDLGHNSAGSQFAPVAVSTEHGLETPPYVNARELTCAVCSK